MWIALILVTGLFCLAAGMAYGFRSQRDDKDEQIRYLRGELGRVNGVAPGSRALATVPGSR